VLCDGGRRKDVTRAAGFFYLSPYLSLRDEERLKERRDRRPAKRKVDLLVADNPKEKGGQDTRYFFFQASSIFCPTQQ
jgi:hypothetical protein